MSVRRFFCDKILRDVMLFFVFDMYASLHVCLTFDPQNIEADV